MILNKKTSVHADQSQSEPVNIKAPIITDIISDQGIQPLLDYFSVLQTSSNVALAAAEAERLGQYFDAFSQYIATITGETLGRQRRVLDTIPEETKTPAGLSGLFNAVASYTRNTLLSEVVIVPDTVFSAPKTKPLFHNSFEEGYFFNGHQFGFGFLQAFQGNETGQAQSSTTFPFLIIDNEMLNNIAPEKAEPLLSAVQKALTIVNHDPLHHLTTMLLHAGNKDIAHPFINSPAGALALENWVWRHAKSFEYDGTTSYEAWAHIAQEKIVLSGENNAIYQALETSIDDFLSALSALAADPAQNTKTANDNSPSNKPDCRKIIDFYGTLFSHILGRALPLNHPMMDGYLRCLEQVDPDPARTMGVYLEKSKNRHLLELRDYPTQSEIRSVYSNAGLDLPAPGSTPPDYKTLKLMQLLELSPEDLHPHMPATPDTHPGKKAVDYATIDLVRVVSQQVDFKPA